MYYYLKEYN